MRDNEQVLSDSQVFTASAVSTNVFDSGITDGNGMGAGNPQFMEFVITEAYNTLTSLTLNVETSAGLTGTALDSNKVTIAQRVVPVALLTLGARFIIPIPPVGALRYVGASYTVTGSANSTGKMLTTIISEQPFTKV